MNKLIVLALATVFGTSIAIGTANLDQASAAAPCTVDAVGSENSANGPNSKFTKNGQTVTAKVKVTGTDCNEPVTIASWEAPNAEARPLSAQKLYKHTSKRFGAGVHTISVQAPQCYFQVDVVRGLNPTGPNGTPEYGPERNMGWLLGGSQKCGNDNFQPPATPPAPTYSCDALGITAGASRVVSVNAFRTTAKNATYKYAVINWGDSKTTKVTSNAVGTVHQYAKDGAYTIKATAYFTYTGANGNVREVSSSSVACTAKVIFTTGQPPVVPPVTPPTTPPTTPTPVTPAAQTEVKELPNTGVGSVIGIFTGVSSLAGGAHFFIRRRFF